MQLPSDQNHTGRTLGDGDVEPAFEALLDDVAELIEDQRGLERAGRAPQSRRCAEAGRVRDNGRNADA